MRSPRSADFDMSRVVRPYSTLADTESGQALLIYTAIPDSKSHERLALLGVIGSDFPR
jgi:hypothetical protein